MATLRLRLTGDELKIIRQQLGLTQAQLARRLRVSRVSVARWEAGIIAMRPSHAQAIRFYARTKGVSVTTKRQKAQELRDRIDKAIASRPDHVWRPDSDGGSADWPKQTDDRLPPLPVPPLPPQRGDQ